MLLTLTHLITNKFNYLIKEERSKKVLINVLSSFAVKIFSMAITLTLIPVSLKYTNQSTYGVWLTLSSVITWFNLFDLGLSNGLTNKLASSFALGKNVDARIYLSTTYSFLFLIITFCGVIFFLVNNFVNWNAVFNSDIDNKELKNAVSITFLSFCCTFILKPINDLLKAKQKHFILSIIQVCGNLIALLFIIFIGSYVKSKFIFLCIALGASYPLSLLVATIYFYFKPFKNLAPSFAFIRRHCLKDIFGVSFKFFIIQLSVIVILTSNNFLISYFVDNQNVTYYNIAYRLFSIVTIFQLLIMTPLWPAFTDAYTLQDFKWIRSIISKSQKLNFLLCIPLIIMLLFCNKIYDIWIGPSIEIPMEINILLVVFVAIGLFKETYVSFINGTGKLNLQTLFSITSIIFHLPLAYFLSRICGFGISGILILNIFWVGISLFLWRKQYRILIFNRINGAIWK